MGSPQVITWMIAGCAMFVAFLFFHKIFLRLFRFLIRGAMWGLGLLVCNTLLTMAGVGAVVGVNIVTVIFAAFLGLPGVVLMYALHVVL